MQRAIVEILLLAVLAGALGGWIVLRRLAFFTHSVGTAAFPGLVVAGAWGIAPQLAALATALGFAGARERLARGDDEDAATGHPARRRARARRAAGLRRLPLRRGRRPAAVRHADRALRHRPRADRARRRGRARRRRRAAPRLAGARLRPRRRARARRRGRVAGAGAARRGGGRGDRRAGGGRRAARLRRARGARRHRAAGRARPAPLQLGTGALAAVEGRRRAVAGGRRSTSAPGPAMAIVGGVVFALVAVATRDERSSRTEALAGGYRPGVDAISGVTFAAEPGEVVAILGPNGGGKSTLFRALLGELPHRRGTVELAGAPAYVPADRARAARLPGLRARRRADGRLQPHAVLPPARPRAGRARALARVGLEDAGGRALRRALRRPAPARADRPRARAGRAGAAARRAAVGRRRAQRRAHRGAVRGAARGGEGAARGDPRRPPGPRLAARALPPRPPDRVRRARTVPEPRGPAGDLRRRARRPRRRHDRDRRRAPRSTDVLATRSPAARCSRS